MDFSFYPLRFWFRALDPIQFPPGLAANMLRGGLGLMLRKMAPETVYQRIFEPRQSGAGPSGLRDLPRPFVIRAAHLDGQTYAPEACFYFDLNLFDVRLESILALRAAFEALGMVGFGLGRGRAEFQSLECLDPEGGSAHMIGQHETKPPACVTIQLTADSEDISEVRIEFLTPMELKAGGEIANRIEFAVLFARIRDRVSILREIYGGGPLDIDFREMGMAASGVLTETCQLTVAHARRRSSRTGQVHEIGGLTGWASYRGQLRRFLPYLLAAEWCGVGRHCVWGNGQIRVCTATVKNR